MWFYRNYYVVKIRALIKINFCFTSYLVGHKLGESEKAIKRVGKLNN